MNKIYLGKVKKDIKQEQGYNPKKDSLSIIGENLYIEKHRWDCDWYWGFGYIGNRNLHTHADVFIEKLLWCKLDSVFENSIFKTNNDFWVFKDLLKQAYSLKKTADTYKYGGHCTKIKGITDIILSSDMNKRINKDLEKVLNKLWDFLTELSKTKDSK